MKNKTPKERAIANKVKVDKLLGSTGSIGLAQPGDVTLAAMLCDHANENPFYCPCETKCYCRKHTCENKP